MVCSAGWLQLLFRFCPAIRHCPGGASSDWPRALSPETNKSAAANAAFDNDTLRFVLDIFSFSLCSILRLHSPGCFATRSNTPIRPAAVGSVFASANSSGRGPLFNRHRSQLRAGGL